MRGLALILLVACSKEPSILDDNKGGGGETLTTLSPTRTMGQLTTEETRKLCEDFKAFQKRTKPSDDQARRMTCQAEAAVTTLAGSGAEPALRSECKKQFDACIAKQDKPPEPELDCNSPEFLGQMGMCKELTIGEISDCVQDLTVVMKKLAAEDLCGTLKITAGTPPTMEIFEKMKSAKCAILETKCQDKAGSGHAMSPDLENKTLAALSDFKGKMCACKDKACVEPVRQEMNRWGEKMAMQNPEFRPSPETAARIAQIVSDYTTCMTTAEAGAGSAK
jgi:hypothetical protein